MSSQILNQAEIDRLLQQIEGDTEENEEQDNTLNLDEIKVYRKSSTPIERIVIGRSTPVLKSRQIVMDPPPGAHISGDKVVVHSLNNYLQAMKMH